MTAVPPIAATERHVAGELARLFVRFRDPSLQRAGAPATAPNVSMSALLDRQGSPAGSTPVGHRGPFAQLVRESAKRIVSGRDGNRVAQPNRPKTAFGIWYHQEKSTWCRRQVLDSSTKFGRRDWTRTNDPHHVKVVL